MEIGRFFQKSDLLPAIVIDEKDGAVLMLAYMNRESLQKTLETGYTWFWSRSRHGLSFLGAVRPPRAGLMKSAGTLPSKATAVRVPLHGSFQN